MNSQPSPRQNDRDRRDHPARVLQGAGVELNVDAHLVWAHGAPVAVSPREFRLLRVLLENLDQVVATDELLNSVWGPAFTGDPSTLTVHILRLRGKLAPPRRSGSPIRTVRGVGYIFDSTPTTPSGVGATARH